MEINKKITKVNRTVMSNKQNKYIVIHYTANNGDTAKNNVDYFYDVDRQASAHYFVDENSIWQCVEDKDKAWHCGTNKTYYHNYCRNENSIGIEMCSRIDPTTGQFYIKDKTILNAIELTKELMKKYNISEYNVIRHYDVTHKRCPAPFVDNPQLWENFKSKLKEEKKLNKQECIEKLKTILSDETIKYLDMYRYGDELITKLGNAMK